MRVVREGLSEVTFEQRPEILGKGTSLMPALITLLVKFCHLLSSVDSLPGDVTQPRDISLPMP